MGRRVANMSSNEHRLSCSFQEKECLFAQIAIFENRIYGPGTGSLLGLEKSLTVMEVTVEYNRAHTA
jgi:hypothetical protein